VKQANDDKFPEALKQRLQAFAVESDRAAWQSALQSYRRLINETDVPKLRTELLCELVAAYVRRGDAHSKRRCSPILALASETVALARDSNCAELLLRALDTCATALHGCFQHGDDERLVSVAAECSEAAARIDPRTGLERWTAICDRFASRQLYT